MAISKKDIIMFLEAAPEEVTSKFRELMKQIISAEELLTEDEIKTIQQGREEFARGETVSWDEVKRNLDL